MSLLRSATIIPIVLALASVSGAYGEGDAAQRIQIMPDDIKWVSLPAVSGLQLAFLIGGAEKPGLYELRVRLAQGAVVPPHTHTDSRCATVLSGELYVGEDNAFEAEKTKMYPPGSFHCVPAGVAHYVWAKNGEVVFQDSGVGPTGTNWVKK